MPAVRTHPGIRNQILLWFVLLTIVPAAAISWLAWRAVDSAIHLRLVTQPVANAASVISEMRLPLTPLMLNRLRQTLGQGDQLAVKDATKKTLVTTLEPAQSDQFASQLKSPAMPDIITVGHKRYALGAARIVDMEQSQHTLYLLVDQDVLASARRDAIRPILWGSIVILLAVIGLGFRISSSITQPIRKLSQQMEQQSIAQLPPDSPAAPTSHQLDAPRELAELAQTFHQMLERLEQTQQRLIAAERLAAIGKIASSVAHEVRNPLAGIRMNLQLLEQHLSRKQLHDESLPIILAELDRLDVIVQEMLVLGRHAEPRLLETDVKIVIEETLAILERRLDHASVRVTLHAESMLAELDPAQIKQVLLNLILNASDAMPTGGPMVIRLIDQAPNVRIEIDDAGPGIELPAGLNPFDWFSTSKSAGSGIGLAVSRQIIQSHHGQIGLSNLQKGCRAWIEIPRKQNRADWPA